MKLPRFYFHSYSIKKNVDTYVNSRCCNWGYLKFKYCEKVTKFEKNCPLFLHFSYVEPCKILFINFASFAEYIGEL